MIVFLGRFKHTFTTLFDVAHSFYIIRMPDLSCLTNMMILRTATMIPRNVMSTFKRQATGVFFFLFLFFGVLG